MRHKPLLSAGCSDAPALQGAPDRAGAARGCPPRRAETRGEQVAQDPSEPLPSVVHSVRIPFVAGSIAIDPVQASLCELDVPVVPRGGRSGPPAFLEIPGAGRDADGA